jgi:hypothetical protein
MLDLLIAERPPVIVDLRTPRGGRAWSTPGIEYTDFCCASSGTPSCPGSCRSGCLALGSMRTSTSRTLALTRSTRLAVATAITVVDLASPPRRPSCAAPARPPATTVARTPARGPRPETGTAYATRQPTGGLMEILARSFAFVGTLAILLREAAACRILFLVDHPASPPDRSAASLLDDPCT